MKLSMPKDRNMLINKPAIAGLLLLSAFSSSLFASFDIFDEESEGYYGSGQTRPFKDAVEGTDDISAKDRAFLDSVEETRVTDRWFMRIMVGKSKLSLNNLTNDSSWALNNFQLSVGSVKDNTYQLLIAGGHIWQQWALEMEVLISKRFSYFTNPVLVGSDPALVGLTPGGTYSTNASVTFNQMALFVNAEYIIPRWFSFYPRRLQVHLDAGVGGALIVSNATGNSNIPTNPNIAPTAQSTSTQSWSAAGMLGAGARYQVSPCVLLGVAYRYYNFGKTKIGPVQQIKWQSNQLQSTGFFIDATYQF